jgi:hypothetical protein
MGKILRFYSFIKENSLPTINISVDELLEPMMDNKEDLISTFGLDSNKISVNDNITDLYDNNEFNKYLSKHGLKKGKLQDTKDFETLLNKDTVMLFFFVYKKDDIEIEEPQHILIQVYNKNKNKLGKIQLFKNDDFINDFYEKLTDTSIELQKGKKSVIYNTSNSGNNWDMKNPENAKGELKKSLDDDQLNKVLKDNKIKITEKVVNILRISDYNE